MTEAEKRIVIGTAGHIDHGKTALVKALTGVDTDRLKEEKRRGITIELGFTSLPLPSGIRCGIVDVPGHERFIDHMVAGATGIDLVMLVVAADEGVMPQTVEHLAICGLLGIRAGLVALTKADLVDEEMRALAVEDVQELVRGTFLARSPIIPFSSLTGEGRETLLAELDRAARRVTEKELEGPVRMPVDRVFTMKGFGTVVTGTLLSGKLAVGDTVDLLPSGNRAKVRGLQVYNQAVPTASAGCRTAVNLQGIEKSVLERGEILAEPDRFGASLRQYVHFHYRPQTDRVLPNRFRLVIHWGTTKVMGRIRFLEGQEGLEPGNSELAQLTLESPLFPVFGDRLIARDFSTNRTLGGGVILDPQAVRFKERDRERILPWLKKLVAEAPGDRVSYYLWRQGSTGGSLREMAVWCRLSEREAANICRELAGRGEILCVDPDQGLFIRADAFDAFKDELLEVIRLSHRENPYQSGIQKESLGTSLKPPVRERLLQFALAWLVKTGEIEQDRERVRIAGHRVRLSEGDASVRLAVLGILEERDVMPPVAKELADMLKKAESELRPLLDYLTQQGELVKVSEGMYFRSTTVEELRNRLTSFLQEKGEIQPGEFKTLSQTTRKYTIPLLEYFDRTRLTLRLGDRRVLRDKDRA